MKLTKKSAYNKIERRWTKTCHSVGVATFKIGPQIKFSKTDWLIEQQIARYLSRLCWLFTRSPSVSMNQDEEADADDLASEVETDRTRQKIRRDLTKFRRRLQERVQLLLS